MPDKILETPFLRELIAVVIAMIAGLVARTLVNNEPFNLRKFCGELILAIMFGTAIYAFGVIQSLGFWQTLLIGLLSGMGTTRSLEWLISASKAVRS